MVIARLVKNWEIWKIIINKNVLLVYQNINMIIIIIIILIPLRKIVFLKDILLIKRMIN
jgi:hypothetical protein